MSTPQIIVGLEASARDAQVAVRAGSRVVEVELASQRAHASDLLTRLDQALDEVGCSARAINAVLVGTGPGSFTGLRVGIATALGLCRGSCAVMLGVPSFESLVYGELSVGESACVVMDARGGQHYFARYERTEDDVRVDIAARVATLDEVRELAPEGIVLADQSSLDLARGTDRDVSPGWRLASAVQATQLLELGHTRLLRDGPSDPNEVQPLYLRPFAAKKRAR